MQKPAIRLIIIGDEILSGRRQDKHFSRVVELLKVRGLKLKSAQIISDAPADIERTLAASFATNDIVFSCGGIGATPDDRTRQAAAAALGVELALHPEAKALITERTQDQAGPNDKVDMSTPENQQRLEMGVFPVGAEIVPNPYNKIPGFFINNHTFTPGFPVMAWPMIEWVLDNKYRQFQHKEQHTEHSFVVFSIPESRIVPALLAVEQRWPAVQAFSLPSMGETGHNPHIELGVKGEPTACAEAIAYLQQQALALGATLSPLAK